MDQAVQNNLFLLQRRAAGSAVGWESGYSRHELVWNSASEKRQGQDRL